MARRKAVGKVKDTFRSKHFMVTVWQNPTGQNLQLQKLPTQLNRKYSGICFFKKEMKELIQLLQESLQELEKSKIKTPNEAKHSSSKFQKDDELKLKILKKKLDGVNLSPEEIEYEE